MIDPIRRKIETLSKSLSLPTVRKAMGILEGEHPSSARFGNDGIMDIRPYDMSDEARHIDWKISARSGRPMVVQRERLSSSRVYLLCDVGTQMKASCTSGEYAYQVAANALCMFAALSLRRSDDITLMLVDAQQATHVPFHGSFAQFEHTLDREMHRRIGTAPRDIDALLDCARHICDRNALIVIVSQEHAFEERHIAQIRQLTQQHPLLVVDVAVINPFTVTPVKSQPNARIVDENNHRYVPAFLRSQQSAQEIETHRAYNRTALEHVLSHSGAQLLYAASSQAMFEQFVQRISLMHTSYTQPLTEVKGVL